MSDTASHDEIRKSYGINREIHDGYDGRCSVKCENGTFVGCLDNGILIFRGIPFALPPTGELRWKRPVPVERSELTFEAKYNGKSPIQTEWETERASFYPQGEDCLYLNVWCSDTSSENKTIMVFFHGGSYGWGGTADPLYDGFNFVLTHPEIVLVTVGYRTGIMGFVDLSYFEGGDNYPDAPNLGLLDQIEALRWIKRNISSFGGDPANVTIFGESAGAGSVSLLPLISESKGLFNRVIAQSGSVSLSLSVDECRLFSEKLKKETGASSVSDLLSLSEDELKRINRSINVYNNFPQRDGRLIPEDPYLPYKNGEVSGIDFLIGTNANELNYWVGEMGGIVPYSFGFPIKYENDFKNLPDSAKTIAKNFLYSVKGKPLWRISELYNEIMFRLPAIRQADGLAENGGNVYMYYWTVPSELKYRKACHAVELAYVFGNTENTIYTGKSADRELSGLIMDMWANFARTGDPSVNELKWPKYDAGSRATMVLSKKPEVKTGLLENQRKMLDPLVDYMINPAYTDIDYNVPFVRKTAAIAGGLLLALAAVILLIILL